MGFISGDVGTGGGGPPSGAAGGDLAGSYPNPNVAVLAITDAKVAAANKDGIVSIPSMRTIGPGATQVVAGNDSRLTDTRTPSAHATSHQHGGSDEVATATPAANAIPKADGSGKLNSWVDAVLTSTSAGGDLSGTFSNLQLVSGAITNADVNVSAAIVESKLSLNFPTHTSANDPTAGEKAALVGTNGIPGALNTYCTDTDGRLNNARTPTAHATSHQNGGSDEVGTATPTADAIVKASASGTLAAGWGGAANTLATLDGSTLVVQNPANATATPTASKIPIADAFGKLDGWVTAGLPAAHASTHLPGGTDALTTASAVANPPGSSSATGTATSFARSDHTHALAAFGTAAATFTEGNDSRLPSSGEKSALAGTSGTPGVANAYVTDADSRNTNTRTPTAHAASHLPGGSDALTTAAAIANPPGTVNAVGTATSFARSDHGHALAAFGTGATDFCVGNDSRLSDSRAPNGTASGDLSGTYPSPSVATLGGLDARAIAQLRSDNTDLHSFMPQDQYALTGSPQTANEIQYTRIWLYAGTILVSAKYYLNSGANSVRQFQLGLYSQSTPSSNTGVPNTRVAVTATHVPTTGTTGFQTRAFAASYTVTTSGWYWLAIQCDNATPSFLISNATFRADTSNRSEENPVSFGLPATAGTTTSPQSQAIYVAGVE